MQTADKYFIREWTRSSRILPKGNRIGILEVGHYAAPSGELYPEEISMYAAIVWVVEGQLIIKSECGDLVASSGEAIIIAPGTRFSSYCERDCTEFHYLALDGEDANQTIEHAKLWEGTFVYQTIPLKWLDFFASEINNVERHNTIASNATLMFDTLRTEAEENAMDKLIFEAETTIHKNWNDTSFNINQLLFDLKISRSTLYSRFKKETNFSPQEYLNNIRYKNALKMLQRTPFSCSDIANACGFNDTNYFSKWFANIYGNLPSSIGKRK